MLNTTTVKAYDGFGYYEEGTNPNLFYDILHEQGTFNYYYDGENPSTTLSRKATAYNWANSPTKAAAEPRVAGNPVAAILNMFSPDKMAESYGAIGKDIEKRENIRQNAEVEYKKLYLVRIPMEE